MINLGQSPKYIVTIEKNSAVLTTFVRISRKALVLVNPTVLEIFQPDLVANALVFVNPTVLEIFQPQFVRKALLLVNPTVLEIF